VTALRTGKSDVAGIGLTGHSLSGIEWREAYADILVEWFGARAHRDRPASALPVG
jgi:hypothetical protein